MDELIIRLTDRPRQDECSHSHVILALSNGGLGVNLHAICSNCQAVLGTKPLEDFEPITVNF
jgi:hypothetical protein